MKPHPATRGQTIAPLRFELLADDTLLIALGDPPPRDDADRLALNARVHACVRRIEAQRPPWLLEYVPAYECLAVCFDLQQIAAAQVQAWIGQALAGVDGETAAEALASTRVIEIPVHYGGENGPDLDAVATHARMPADTVIRLHSETLYTVAMIGFAPGFPYLLGLDARLAMPRMDTPRTQVAAGSVGIGGAQTGVYPRTSPGGWRIIGRTDADLFDAQRSPPSRLQPGDRVRFVPVRA